MPDFLSHFLTDYKDSIWLGFVGFIGASVRLALGIDSGTKTTPARSFATLVSGVVFACSGPSAMSSIIGLSPGANALAGFVWGLIGIAASELIIRNGPQYLTKFFKGSEK